MPVIQKKYTPPLLFRNGHLNTIYPAIFRNHLEVNYERERIFTPDNDFLDLDWSRIKSDSLVILLHGLESNSEVGYIKGMVQAMNRRTWDAVAMNFRGCSGEPNWTARAYHSGETGDLSIVIQHILENYHYKKIALIGYSLGGNVVLKYLGEKGSLLPQTLKAACAISVPCDLYDSAQNLSKPSNWIYLRRFMQYLKGKIIEKKERFPDQFQHIDPDKIKDFKDFDGLYTAPIHGFKDEVDYWRRSSSKNFVAGIQIPTLLLNALDDPFLTPTCYPYDAAKVNANFHILTPKYGGHVGFYGKPEFWSEEVVGDFFQEYWS